MKLRNLIFSLFLVIGAIGFTACTGDDGAQGPPGPPGPQGEPGEPGDSGDSGDATGFYDFLTTWGHDTGEIGCGDPILTGSGPFPGPALAPITMPDATNDLPIELQCVDSTASTPGLFVTIPQSSATSPTIVVAGQTVPTTGGAEIVLVKTMRGEEEESVVDTPSSEFNQAVRTTTTKNFVGGLVFADLNMTGAFDEPDERRLLYSDCGVGTAPSDVRGTWRGIQIVEKAQVFTNGVGAVVSDSDPTPVTTDTTTVKVCVKLDAHPGVTKCYVNVAGGANAGAQIALYNEDGTLTTLKDNDALVGAGGTAIDSTAGLLFATGDLPGAEEVCEIFDDGSPDGSN